MLVLTRKCNEAIVIGEPNGVSQLLKITVVGVRNGKVRLGIEVADDVSVHRWEVWQRICAQKRPKGASIAAASMPEAGISYPVLLPGQMAN
jgi:carbon storage regulator